MKDKTLAESSELLRMSLPLMAKYAVPVTPTNYAVWYEYVIGDNFLLKTKIDGMIEGGSSVDDGITQLLYSEYVDPNSGLGRAEQTQKALDSIAESVSRTIMSATGDVTRYEESLAKYEGKINEGMKTEQIQSLVSELSNLTKDMHKGNDALLEDLAEGRKEANRLREELEIAKTEASTDPLTGLANRKAFFDRISEMKEDGKSKDSKIGHSVLLADIDKFKRINDTYGHLFGDKVIKIVAAIINKTTKGNDLAARFGGEEFLILLPDTALDGAKAVAESIRRNMEEGRIIKPKTGEKISQVTISIGVSHFFLDEEMNEVIARADEALYRAKDNGRNRVEVGHTLEGAGSVH